MNTRHHRKGGFAWHRGGLTAKVAGLVVTACFAVQASSELTATSVHQLSPQPISVESQSLGRQRPSLLVRSAAGVAVPTQLYSHGDPTAEEQLMLELVNRARANPAAEAARFGIDLNEGIDPDTIPASPKQPLAFNVQLLQSARGHSQWMLDNDSFTHFEGDLRNPVDPGARMRAAGYVFSGSYSYGENLAYEATTGPPLPVGPTVALEHSKLFIDAPIEDRGHRLNLMNASFREVGIGVGLGLFAIKGMDYNTVMVTQDFGSTDANPGPFLVGVVYRDSDGDGFYGPGEGLAGVTVTPAAGKYYAITSSSGGYAIPVGGSSASLRVTFSGGSLGTSVNKSVSLTAGNAKLDVEANADAVVPIGFASGSARRALNGNFEADLYGPANALLSIEASENLRQWNKLGDVSLVGGTAHFIDTQTSGQAHRSYRAVKR